MSPMKNLMLVCVLAVCGCSTLNQIDLSGIQAMIETAAQAGSTVTNGPSNPLPHEPAYTNSTTKLQDAVDLSSCTVYEANKAAVLTFAVTVKITGVSVGKYLTWTTEERLPWKSVDGCDGQLWCFLFRDGKWIASPCDQIRTGQAYKGRQDFKVYNGTEVLRPVKGEQCAFMLSTRCRHSVYPNGKERSNIVMLKWPD